MSVLIASTCPNKQLPYQDFSQLGPEQQNDYWRWRNRNTQPSGN